MSCIDDIEGKISTLSIDSSRTNKILWNREKLIGTVNTPKGNIWNTIGEFHSRLAFIYAEEAFFLAEYHGFDIFDSSSNIKLNSIAHIMEMFQKGCGFNSYKLFKILKKHGYTLMRPESKYFPKTRLFDSLRGEYSLFKPSSTFKKTSPSGLIAHVFEVRQNDDFDLILEKLSKVSGSVILAISDETNGFLFLEAFLVCPTPSRFGLNSNQSKLSRSPKSISN